MKRRLVTMALQAVIRESDPDFREDPAEQKAVLEARWKETVPPAMPSEDAALDSFVIEGMEDL